MQICLLLCEVGWIVVGHAPRLEYPLSRYPSGLHVDLRLVQARCRQGGIEIDGELQANLLVFGVERTEVNYHCRLDTFEMVFGVLIQRRSYDLGSDETSRKMIVGVKYV
jgi:hypothetical protein